ncbi:hypothetical protein IGI04_006002 [Brassica rapa subsp. trilocularis]|uniref:Uncharacterized protein n=1 Tax=Brassica rapa subsp. trilocularis TaxID=1813537 RepID=A0ABQ7NFK6_BRACM|nr:hypothetical protein IGI04_006002 [Brassica rapa subsp. trilocularis]
MALRRTREPVGNRRKSHFVLASLFGDDEYETKRSFIALPKDKKTQFWSRPKWVPNRDMDQDMPKPTTRIELEEGVTEVVMIAELARKSRSRLAIKKGEKTKKRTR